jgi:hypothetical protein
MIKLIQVHKAQNSKDQKSPTNPQLNGDNYHKNSKNYHAFLANGLPETI